MRGDGAVKIGIIGTGISGVATAHLLHGHHEITVFEANEGIGGHTNTVEVAVDGRPYSIDTGFIVYNERTYPNFTRLLTCLGVASQPSEMSFSVACERSGLEYASRSLNAIFAQRRNLLRPSFRRMLSEILRFNGEARDLLATGDEKQTLGDYLCGAGYSTEFVDRYVIPMGAAIWSASPREFLAFPASSFVRFFDNHGLLDRSDPIPWRVIQGGSRSYVEALVAPFRDRIRTGCPVRAIRRGPRGVDVATLDGRHERFDRVVIAVHSDEALRLLEDPSDVERLVLGSIGYQPNEAVLHKDASVMPRLRRAWASWNYRVPAEPRDGVFVSYHMNRLQGLDCNTEFFVTLNGSDRIDPRQVLARFLYSHPVFDARAIEAQKLHHAIDGANRTHFCGAYWGYGFHEDGLRSALTVCRKFGRGL
jgi:predicted NAD/FAD-binding protein